jgi:hypothetical protein
MIHLLVRSSHRVLDPAVRVAEILFGLIMVLTFTGSLSVAEAGRDDVRVMLIGALGCNLAWGIIDGLFYLMDCMSEKGQALTTYLAVRRAKDPAEARRLIGDALPSVVTEVLEPQELDAIHRRLLELPDPPARLPLDRSEYLGSLGVLVLVFLSTLPVAIPFMVMKETGPAMRVSNAIAIALLFFSGYMFGRISNRRPWLMGVSMVIVGALLVVMTIALGG